MCDGAGGLEAIDPVSALKMARYRVKDLAETGAKTLVTSCPVCVMMLKRGREELRLATEIIDIQDIVMEAIQR